MGAWVCPTAGDNVLDRDVVKFVQGDAKQPPIIYAKILPYSLTCGDVITFELLLTTISSNFTE